jgi:hypothetical protein
MVQMMEAIANPKSCSEENTKTLLVMMAI